MQFTPPLLLVAYTARMAGSATTHGGTSPRYGDCSPCGAAFGRPFCGRTPSSSQAPTMPSSHKLWHLNFKIPR